MVELALVELCRIDVVKVGMYDDDVVVEEVKVEFDTVVEEDTVVAE